MKKKLILYCALCCAIMLALSSCKKDENRATVAEEGQPASLKASANTIVLNKAKTSGSDTSVVFNITQPKLGFSAATTNILQIDMPGDNWKNPQSVTLAGGTTTQTLSTIDFNSMLLKLKVPPTVASEVQARVVSSVSSHLSALYSNVVTLSVTPFSIASYLYVPGAYQGWSPEKADSLLSSTGNGIYSGIINFNGSDPGFKITTTKSWSTAVTYGAGPSAGTISSTGDNLAAPSNGGLLVNLNTGNNTISFVPQWSIIGDATTGSWDKDTNMYLDKTSNTWYLTAILVSDGTKAMKFRFNNKWDVNLGGSGGKLSQGGDDIAIPKTASAGDNYRISLNANNNTYTLIKL